MTGLHRYLTCGYGDYGVGIHRHKPSTAPHLPAKERCPPPDLPAKEKCPPPDLPSKKRCPPPDLPSKKSKEQCPPPDLPAKEKCPPPDLPSKKRCPPPDLPSKKRCPPPDLPSKKRCPPPDLPAPPPPALQEEEPAPPSARQEEEPALPPSRPKGPPSDLPAKTAPPLAPPPATPTSPHRRSTAYRKAAPGDAPAAASTGCVSASAGGLKTGQSGLKTGEGEGGRLLLHRARRTPPQPTAQRRFVRFPRMGPPLHGKARGGTGRADDGRAYFRWLWARESRARLVRLGTPPRAYFQWLWARESRARLVHVRPPPRAYFRWQWARESRKRLVRVGPPPRAYFRWQWARESRVRLLHVCPPPPRAYAPRAYLRWLWARESRARLVHVGPPPLGTGMGNRASASSTSSQNKDRGERHELHCLDPDSAPATPAPDGPRLVRVQIEPPPRTGAGNLAAELEPSPPPPPPSPEGRDNPGTAAAGRVRREKRAAPSALPPGRAAGAGPDGSREGTRRPSAAPRPATPAVCDAAHPLRCGRGGYPNPPRLPLTEGTLHLLRAAAPVDVGPGPVRLTLREGGSLERTSLPPHIPTSPSTKALLSPIPADPSTLHTRAQAQSRTLHPQILAMLWPAWLGRRSPGPLRPATRGGDTNRRRFDVPERDGCGAERRRERIEETTDGRRC
ncbi:basic salivary proline-rich protein 2-like [Perognathus longimembris pacificus]|uniref:basic salivary proline-rich protein 2-like n=1 Tax=Perognathus longimembris pacificus TaxID=214514 RepID=UPI00201864F9|nr:basic salivary proline-rich protein 2-like [Perognathus longimembris pacificus]